MREKIAITLLIIMLILTACSQTNVVENKEEDQSQSQSKKNLELETIELTFNPVSIDPLKEGEPKEEWVKGKSIYFGKLRKQIEATIHLYVENIEDTNELYRGTIYAFLEHEDKLYEIRDVGGYGLENVDVYLKDMNSNGMKEIVISGGMGTNYVGNWVIGYDQNNQQWMNLLESANIETYDLDGNGQEELVSVSYGSLPGFVKIYRWNQDHFGTANVAESIGNDYAYLHNKEGKWFIESGRSENGKVLDTKFYRYESGKLVEQDKIDLNN